MTNDLAHHPKITLVDNYCGAGLRLRIVPRLVSNSFSFREFS
jgi:hypothetical protein